DVDLLPEHGELFHRRGTAHVERGHEHLAPRLLDEALGELGGGGGLARALQADHHDRHRRRGIEIDRLAARAEGVDQLVVNDLHHHLARRHRFDDFDPDGVALHLVDEGAHHVERDVGFEQGTPHFAQRGIDVRLGERAAPRQPIEDSAEPFGERIEHLVPRPGFVIAGLNPAIHPLREQMDARVKPGHDAVSVCPRSSTKHLRRPRAHCAVGRWPPACRAGRRVAFRLLTRARGAYGCGVPKSRTPLCGGISCVSAAAYSRLRLPLLSQRELARCPPTMEGSPMQITRVLFIALAAIGVSADRTWSQPSTADYPNRQANFVVLFAPGGGTDILGRLIGQKLSDRFGKPFVVENRPGAGTVTAAVQVAKSPPDGYTIMMATSGTMAMN